MKACKIYVGINGNTLELASGAKAVAVYPAQKGDKESVILMDSGAFGRLKGARINGVGIARYLTEHGFELASADNPEALKLADYLDADEGRKMVGEVSSLRAHELQQRFGGQTCTYVPFDPECACVEVQVEPSRGYSITAFNMATRFNSGVVQVALPMADVQLSSGWLVGPDELAADMPRSTEYGGLVEQAVFVICNSGLGTLEGLANLAMTDAPDATYPRGSMTVRLSADDLIVVGIDACDEVVVEYRRGDTTLYSRQFVASPYLGEVIGNIAAALVRVRELDAIPAKKNARKKAAA